MNGIFEVTATDSAVTPNVCEKATVTVIGYSVPNAVDTAHTVVSKWSKATGIPVSCDGYSIVKREAAYEGHEKFTFEFYVI